MSIFKNLYHKIKKMFYGLFFGLENANQEVFTNVDYDSSSTNIHQEKLTKSVYKDLLKGEITQEVKDLRYQLYYIYDNSQNYKYIGDGNSEKKTVNTFNCNEFAFSQSDKDISVTLSEELNFFNKEQYFFNIIYEDYCRFKHEKYITKIDVNVSNKRQEKNKVIYFYYNAYVSTDNVYYRILLNGLKSKKIENNDFFPTIKEFSFTTFNAQGINDLYKFNLYNLKPLDVLEKDGFILVEYEFENFQVENIVAKYFSQDMQDKYDKKASKIENTLFLKKQDFSEKNFI